MQKSEIIKNFLPKLENKYIFEFQKLATNSFFKFIKNEAVFQFFITRILKQKNIAYVLLQNESNKTVFERYANIVMGNQRGWSDLFIPKFKLFLELKAESPYTQKGHLKKSEHLTEQANFLTKMRYLGYSTFFLYPENFTEFEEKYLK